MALYNNVGGATLQSLLELASSLHDCRCDVLFQPSGRCARVQLHVAVIQPLKHVVCAVCVCVCVKLTGPIGNILS